MRSGADPSADLGMADLLRAYLPVFCVRTAEVERSSVELRALAEEIGMEVFSYSPGEGLTRDGRKWVNLDPVQLLSEIVGAHLRDREKDRRTLWVLKFFQGYLKDADPVVLSLLRALHDRLRFDATVVLMVDPRFTLPAEIQDFLTVAFPLPDKACLEELLASDLEPCPAEERAGILSSLRGLTHKEAENILSLALLKTGRFDPGTIRSFKQEVIRDRSGGLLDICEAVERLEDVGGMRNLREWLQVRGAAFRSEEKLLAVGLPPPRGMVLLGVPGCGKTLAARAVAGSWGLPLLKVEASRLYTAEVGGSERRLGRVLETARSLAPCVLLIDEIEKGFPRVSSYSDGGIALRIQSTLLDFLQEGAARIFCVATSNGLSEMPPELLRKGRWDEIFFVDLPDEQERGQILEVLFRRYRISTGVDEACLRASEGFSGAEIEQAVRDTLYVECIFCDRPFSPLALIRQMKSTVPLSRVRYGEIAALRTWASRRVRFAN